MSRVSVIIPYYNGEAFIADALESVRVQTLSDVECIVVDDGSHVRYPFPEWVRVFRQENRGNALARMRGIEEAGGEYIAFLDQDDLFLPNKLEIQLRAFDEGTQVVFGKARFENRGAPASVRSDLFSTSQQTFLPGACVARKTLFMDHPMYPHFTNGSDTEWMMRLKDARVDIKTIKDTVLTVRLHQNNLSHNPRHYKELLRIVHQRKHYEDLVTVIICCHNEEAFLKEAIESVLSQTHPHIECIVVNDGSTDSTETIARSFGSAVHYIAQQKRGLSAARNRGLFAAQGTYIAFLDADDLADPDRIAYQLQSLSPNTLHFVSPREEYLCDLPKQPHKRRGLPSGFLCETATARAIGRFDEALSVTSFTDWCARAEQMNIARTIDPAIHFTRRIHGNNMSYTKNAKEYFHLLRRYSSL